MNISRKAIDAFKIVKDEIIAPIINVECSSDRVSDKVEASDKVQAKNMNEHSNDNNRLPNINSQNTSELTYKAIQQSGLISRDPS